MDQRRESIDPNSKSFPGDFLKILNMDPIAKYRKHGIFDIPIFCRCVSMEIFATFFTCYCHERTNTNINREQCDS